MSAKTWAILFVGMCLLLTACGGSPATMKNTVVYPDAKEISQADSQLLDVMNKIAKNDTTLAIVLNAKEKKIYRLSSKMTWTDVRVFYEKNLDSSEWQLVPPSVSLVERSILPSDISEYHVELWVRGNQAVGIAFVASSQSVELFVGLNAP